MRRLWQQAAGGWTRRPTRWSSPTWRSAAQSCTPSTAVRSSRGERHNVDFVTQRECSPCAHAHVGYLRMSHIFKPFCVKLIESELASSFLQRQRQGVHRGAGIGHHCHARVIGVATAVCSNRAAFAKPPSCPSASIRLQSVSSVLTSHCSRPHGTHWHGVAMSLQFLGSIFRFPIFVIRTHCRACNVLRPTGDSICIIQQVEKARSRTATVLVPQIMRSTIW